MFIPFLVEEVQRCLDLFGLDGEGGPATVTSQTDLHDKLLFH
jgi:hypothetical protein